MIARERKFDQNETKVRYRTNRGARKEVVFGANAYRKERVGIVRAAHQTAFGRVTGDGWRQRTDIGHEWRSRRMWGIRGAGQVPNDNI